MAAATRLDFILVLCLEPVKCENHLKSLRWVLLAPGNAGVGFTLLVALFLNVDRIDVHSLSFARPWTSESQSLELNLMFRIHTSGSLPLPNLVLCTLRGCGTCTSFTSAMTSASRYASNMEASLIQLRLSLGMGAIDRPNITVPDSSGLNST
jgi:hypothetical protein